MHISESKLLAFLGPPVSLAVAKDGGLLTRHDLPSGQYILMREPPKFPPVLFVCATSDTFKTSLLELQKLSESPE